MAIGSRIRGGLYGVAVGDALGATVEFMAQEIVQKRYGVLTDIIGGGWLGLAPGDWTEDTELTLAVASGIVQAPHDPVNAVGEEFLRWYKTNPSTAGTTIAAVFQQVIGGCSWHEAAYQLHCKTAHTAGNEALMRTLPVGLAYCERKELMDKTQAVAQMTHWDNRAVITCQLYSMLAYFLLGGKNIADSISAAHLWLAEHYPDREALQSLWLELKEKMAKPESTGYTVDTLACVLWALKSGADLEQAVIAAVNLGGNANTVGALTGGLAGVCYGFEAIPSRWLAKISPGQRERLDKAAASIKRLRGRMFMEDSYYS